ncbi:MFS transporter [Lactobacillus bombicola]|uniref:MFS transporter n=1 Tax=Lactobacillus bombicola TaxID=1505723 RepID=A0A396SQN5_9LACO|nr:MFS transporter [Lactobacillus bombicola]RHW53774.1 MFS transporter [Lactobacillus bombicola]
MKKQIKNNEFIYYFSIFLISLGVALPHSVLTVLLIKKGLSLSSIMVVQAIYSLAVLVGEYPSGLIADMFSKKAVFIISKFLLLIMFLAVIYFNNVIYIAIAWFIYGISSALDSGTLDAELINDLKIENLGVEKFIGTTNKLSFVAELIGSTIGSFIFYRIGVSFYWLSIILTLLAVFITVVGFKEVTINHLKKKTYNFWIEMINQSKEGLKEVRKKSTLKLMIALTFVGQFFFQAHFQLWQALLLYKGLDKKNFYIIYILFQLLSVAAYSVPIKKLLSINLNKIFCFVFIALMSCLFCLLENKNNIIFIFIYLTFVFIFTIFNYFSDYLFAKKVSYEHISSLTSLKSSCGRIASILAMLESSILLQHISVLNTVMINFGFAAILSVIIVFKFKKSS